jgi:hypothetical protein
MVNAECEKPSNKVMFYSNVYLEKMTVSVLDSDYTCENDVLLV